MLTIFFGTDVEKVRSEAFHYSEKVVHDGASLTRIESHEYVRERMIDAANGASLFGTKSVYIIDSPKENTFVFETFLADAKNFADSEHFFIVIEKGLTAPEKKILEKAGASLHEYTKGKEQKYNTFALADAFCARDKKTLWMLLHEAVRERVTYEEIIGVLFWQLKTMVLIERVKTAEAANMQGFTFSKAQRALTRFKREELQNLFYELLCIYHDGHTGKRDIGRSLEKWILTL